MRLSTADKKVIKAFLDDKPAESKKLRSTGSQLDGLWMGGRGIARWHLAAIDFTDLGSGAAQTVQRAIIKEAPGKWFSYATREGWGIKVASHSGRIRTRRNPDIDISRAGIENTFDAVPNRGRAPMLWHFSFGAYGSTHVFVWAGPAHTALEDALEEAAAWVAENSPVNIHSEEEMSELYKEAADELGVSWPPEDWDDPEVEQVREEAETDMTYTEAGWLNSSYWGVDEIHDGDLYNEVWEASIDALAEEGDLTDDDIEEANKFAAKHGIDAEWEFDEENPSDDVDQVLVEDLVLFIDNTGELYGQKSSIEKNLTRKWKKGTYSEKLAPKLWGYLAESGAKLYAKEFRMAGKWFHTFTPAVRKAASEQMAEQYQGELEVGNFHE